MRRSVRPLLSAIVASAALAALAPTAWACPTKRTDLDGDCTANYRDRDMDGDRRSNSRDADVDGDRVANSKDRQPFGPMVKGTRNGYRAPGRIAIVAPGRRVRVPAGVSVPREFIGVVAEDALAETGPAGAPVMRDLQAAGVGLLRQTLEWSRVELRPGVYDFTAYDHFVADAARHGIQVLPVLFNPPAFHSSAPARGAVRGTYPPASNDAFARFAAVVARRYGPAGSFWRTRPDIPAVPIRAWQVWNEPNLPVYWAPAPKAAAYTAMLRAVHDAIKAVDPAATVVTAGIPDSRLGIPAGKFLAQMYAAGARGSFDAVGANPYATTADGVFENLRALRRQMNRNGDGASIWVTEIGWGTTSTRAPFDPGPAWQRALIGQTIPMLAQKAPSLRLRGIVYYAWRDLPVYAGGRDFWGLHTGLVNKDGSAKPVLRLFSQIVRQIVR